MQFKLVILVFACVAAITEWEIDHILLQVWPSRDRMTRDITRNTVAEIPAEDLAKTSSWMPSQVYRILKEMRDADNAGRRKIASVPREGTDGEKVTQDLVDVMVELAKKLATAWPYDELIQNFLKKLAPQVGIYLLRGVCADLWKTHSFLQTMCMKYY